VEVAQLLGVSAAAISIMLGKLQSNGLSTREKRQIERTWEQLTTAENPNGLSTPMPQADPSPNPKVLALKRLRKRTKG